MRRICALVFGAAVAVWLIAASGCRSVEVPSGALRVGTYNIRHSRSGGRLVDKEDGANFWDLRKADTVAFLRGLDLDVFGLQEVYPEQLAYIREHMPEYGFVGDHRYADRISGEASPVCYRKSRFAAEKAGTFWLSETPDVPGSKSWNTAATRICSYLVLKDGVTGGRFCFANTHTDHKSELAREKGTQLIIDRMNDFGAGAPIVFVGDLNCLETSSPVKAVSARLGNAMYLSETLPQGAWRTFNNWRWREREVTIAEAHELRPEERNDMPGRTVGSVDAFGVCEPRDGSFYERCAGCRIDYIFVSPGTRVIDYRTVSAARPSLKRYPSDHFPVVSTVVLPKAKGEFRR